MLSYRSFWIGVFALNGAGFFYLLGRDDKGFVFAILLLMVGGAKAAFDTAKISINYDAYRMAIYYRQRDLIQKGLLLILLGWVCFLVPYFSAQHYRPLICLYVIFFCLELYLNLILFPALIGGFMADKLRRKF